MHDNRAHTGHGSANGYSRHAVLGDGCIDYPFVAKPLVEPGAALPYVPGAINSYAHDEDATILIKAEFLKTLLRHTENAHFTPVVYDEDDGSTTITLHPLDLVANGANREEAIVAAVEDAIIYARDYLDPANFPLYSRSPNRRDHLNLVVRIALGADKNEVRELLGLA